MKKLRYVVLVVLVFLLFNAGQCPKILDIGFVPMQEVEQETNSWCWAASMQAILAMFEINVNQCEEVNWAYDRNDCCNNPTPNDCIRGADGDTQQQVLDHWGLDSNLVFNHLTWSQIKTEIKAGRPINMGWLWCCTYCGGHSLNIYGFSEVKNGTVKYNVMYMDPWPGEGYNTASYDWVVGSCPGDHEWYRTLYDIHEK